MALNLSLSPNALKNQILFDFGFDVACVSNMNIFYKISKNATWTKWTNDSDVVKDILNEMKTEGVTQTTLYSVHKRALLAYPCTATRQT